MKKLKNKKVLMITLATAAAVIGISAGSVFAQDEEELPKAGAGQGAALERICEIYEANTGVALDAEELQNAFTEAHQEMVEEAMTNRLNNMVENGIITQEEADQYKEWLESRPDVAIRGMQRFNFVPGGHAGRCMGNFRTGAADGEFCPALKTFSTN